MWRENAWVGFGLSAFTLVAIVGMVAMQGVAVSWWKAVRARRARFFGFLGEQLDGTEDIRANGGAPFMLHRFTKMLRGWLPEEVKGRLGFAALWGTNIASYVLGTALVFWLGSVFFGRGDLTIGSVYLIFHYTELARHPMDQIKTPDGGLPEGRSRHRACRSAVRANLSAPQGGNRASTRPARCASSSRTSSSPTTTAAWTATAALTASCMASALTLAPAASLASSDAAAQARQRWRAFLLASTTR